MPHFLLCYSQRISTFDRWIIETNGGCMTQKMKIVSSGALAVVLILAFQNCSSHKAGTSEGTQGQASVNGSWGPSDSQTGLPIVGLPTIDPVTGDIISLPSVTTTVSHIPTNSFLYKTVLQNSSGNPVEAVCNAVAVDLEGNSYCAGHTSSDFAEVSAGGTDAFVMKVNSSGQVQWVRQLGKVSLASITQNYTAAAGDGAIVNHNDFANSVAVDSLGNVYMGGSMSPTRHKSGNSVVGYSGGLVGGGAFVLKLNAQGSIQWLKHMNDDPNKVASDCTGLATDSVGNVYCTGTAVDFAEKSANNGKGDAFVVKLNSQGTIQWKRQLGSVSNIFGDSKATSRPTSVSVDNMGNVYTAGVTDGSLAEALGGGNDAFVMKLNSQGVIQWVKQLGASYTQGDSSEYDMCYGVAVDHLSNVYCAGMTTGRLKAGATANRNGDAFVAKLNSQGAVQWVHQWGESVDGGSQNRCHDVSVDVAGNVYCAGYSNILQTTGSSGFILKIGANQ